MADPISNIFVDQSESPVAIIGNSYLQNFLTNGGKIEKGYGVLTQKRFYYKGKNYGGSGMNMTSTTEEGVVSIEDIAFTAFVYSRPVGLLICGLLFLIVGGLLSFVQAVFLALLFAGILLVVLAFINRTTIFQISFPGGSFSFDVRYYPIEDIKDFQRQIHLLKGNRKGV